jgi:tetratricopeptide (TPR) repeat protein
MARGYLLATRDQRTYAGVREVFQRALALDPRNSEVHHQFGSTLRQMGLVTEAVRELDRALVLEPQRPITLWILGEIATAGREFDAAQRWLDSAVAADPGFFYAYALRARLRGFVGDLAGARADAEAAVRTSASSDSLWGPTALAFVEARAGDTSAARRDAERLEAIFATRRPPSPQAGWLLAATRVALGDTARALELLEQVAPRGGRLAYYLRMPEFDPVRGSDRFQRLLEQSLPRLPARGSSASPGR